jgi:hypothetical protein
MSPRPDTVTLASYLEHRGFDTSSAGSILRRIFVESWFEPGLHRFWRAWNPVYGYALWRLYVALGGRRRPVLATLVAFAACGFFAHDLVTFAITGKPTLAITITFLFLGALTLASRVFEAKLRQERLPRQLNLFINLLLIGFGLVAGPVVWSLLHR